MLRVFVPAIALVIALIAPASVSAGPTRLTGAEVSARAGTPATSIEFEVVFRNREGSPADWVRVRIGGATQAMAQVGDGSWKEGVRFRWAGTLPLGSHAIVFEAMSRDRFEDTLGAGQVVISPPPTPKPTPKPTATTKPPNPTPKPTATTAPTPEPTPVATARSVPTPKPTTAPPTPKPSATANPTAKPAATPVPTQEPTATPRAGALQGPTAEPTPLRPPEATPRPTTAPTTAPTATPTDPPEATPTPESSPDDVAVVIPPGKEPTGGGDGGSAPTGGDGKDDPDTGGLVAALTDLAIGQPSLPLGLVMTMTTTTGVVVAAMAFSVFGRRRRDDDMEDPDGAMAAAAATGLAVAGAAGMAGPAPTAGTAVPNPLDGELAMPRWRRPSLLEARKADPTRDVVTAPRLTFDHGLVGALDGRERRLIRYSLVRLLDQPDELRGAEIGFLDNGDEVQLLEKRGVYWLVLTPDGRQGWIHKMTLGDVVGAPEPTAPTATMPIDAESWTMGDDIDGDVLAAYLESRRRA